MKELLVSVNKSAKHKYQALADGLRSAIRQGKVKPGERLPSSRDLARQFKMHRHTVMTALAELESEGWITSQAKKYYQVTATLPDAFLQAKGGMGPRKSEESREIRLARKVDVGSYVPADNFKHSFPSGYPDLRLFPMKEFKSHLGDALKAKGVLSYSDPVGYPKLIKEVDKYIRRARSVADRKIVITNGSQEALFLLAQCLIAPGDYVAVEALGYPPAIEALKFAGGKFLPIQVDEEGVCVEDLEKHLKKKKIKCLYTTPLHQYPTTVTLSAARRLRLYELALKYGFLIIEDDYDHEFHYVSQPVAPLASFDPAGIVIYVSTFSKILFPSSRVGFMAVPEKLGSEVAKLKRISSRQNEQILQATIANWMAEGRFERHLRRMRRIYEERRNSIISDLTQIQRVHPKISWSEPDGGMALWLNIGIDSTKFSETLKKKSILANPESAFRLDKMPGTHFRLGFSGYTSEENRSSLKAMFSQLP